MTFSLNAGHAFIMVTHQELMQKIPLDQAIIDSTVMAQNYVVEVGSET